MRFRLDFPETWTHTTSAAEQTSTVANDVTPTNFSYNTSQYFYEVFTGPTDTTRTFTLTVTYTDPATDAQLTQTLTKTVGSILGLQENNIRDAETIFLFTELLGGRTTRDAVANILTTYYGGYASPLFTEYTGMMNSYLTLSGQSTL